MSSPLKYKHTVLYYLYKRSKSLEMGRERLVSGRSDYKNETNRLLYLTQVIDYFLITVFLIAFYFYTESILICILIGLKKKQKTKVDFYKSSSVMNLRLQYK